MNLGDPRLKGSCNPGATNVLRLYGRKAAMLALGYVTKYSGTDATLGLALAKTGFLYPFFGTLLGWLGVALTGSDTASNVLFGSLQKITATEIWNTGAIGAAVAYERYEIALVLSVINFATLRVLSPLKSRLKNGADERSEDSGETR